jgi:indolepyruvate ferredoxin oxidoreductase alpha subunit
VLCPSFYRATVITNPSAWDRFKARWRGFVIGFLQGRMARPAAATREA